MSDNASSVEPTLPTLDSAVPTGSDFKPDAWRGSPDRHRVGQTHDGQWWWFDPVSGPRFMAGVAGVERSVGEQPVLGQLRGWGFGLLIPPVADGFCQRGLPHLVALDLARAGEGMIRRGGVALPDVFDPRWAEAVAQRVRLAATTTSVAGYLLDGELRWGGEPVADVPMARPGLLQVCLSLDPSHAAYHAAWEFVLATRSGGLADLARDWSLRLPNKETLRQMTLEEVVVDTPTHRVDLERFLREFCQRYHRIVSDAVRVVDGTRLCFSAPVSASTPAVVRAQAAAQADVLLVDEPGLGGGRAPEMVRLTGGALSLRNREPGAHHACGVSELERQVVGIRETLTAWCRDPRVVGYVWSPFVGGDLIQQGAACPGLLDESGRINPLRADPVAAVNAVATSLRAAARV